MKIGHWCLTLLAQPLFLLAQENAALPSTTDNFPSAAILLHDAKMQPEKSKAVFGPFTTDADGKATGSVAFYGGSSLIQIVSLSFSGDGRLLAAGSTPGLIDIWDVVGKKKLRFFEGGTTVALSADGNLLARDANGIEVLNVLSGKSLLKIKWNGGQIRRLSFDPKGKWLLVTANGNDDKIFDVASGKFVAELTHARDGCFSRDGSLLIGGDYRHLITWDTQTWKPKGDLPNGPDYVTTIAAYPEKDLAVIGGPNSARLLNLSSGRQIAELGLGYTNFASFDQAGSAILTYTSKDFGVWDTTGKEYCSHQHMGNGTMALSADGQYLASAPLGKGTDVLIWKVSEILGRCSIAP
jgi:WD40 repeat protein